MKLIIGNKNYSSWSLRGWLAAKQSGLSFEEITVPMFGKEWDTLKGEDGGTQPSHGKVPILWDEEAVVWDSLAILEYLGDKVGRERFWPKDAVARGMARSMVAEMHSSYQALRSECPMNVRKRFEGFTPSEACRQDILRILGLWAEARSRFGSGGPFLFGTFGAADVYFAPVVSRFISYQIAVPGFAAAYMREGLFARPIPIEWEPYRRAIMPEFFSPFGAADYWTAAYLPVNSAIQALFWQLGDPNLAGPVLLMTGLIALWRVALRLMPDRPDAVWVTLLLGLSSSQLWVTAMTPYAMTGHFALNLVWLALVLLGVGWNFLFVGGTTLLPQGYRDEERFRVQGLNDLMVFGSQATAALSAGAVLAAFDWNGLLLIAIPFLVLHGVLMAVWLMSRPQNRGRHPA